jgi:hypothetical protein
VLVAGNQSIELFQLFLIGLIRQNRDVRRLT